METNVVGRTTPLIMVRPLKLPRLTPKGDNEFVLGAWCDTCLDAWCAVGKLPLTAEVCWAHPTP